jgi:hypothetical protein
VEFCQVSPANVADAVRVFTHLKRAALDPKTTAQMLRGLSPDSDQ